MRKIKEESELDRTQKERTLSVKLNEQERKEIELSFKLSQTQEELLLLRD